VWVGAPVAGDAGGIFVFAQDTAGFRDGGVRFLTATTIAEEADVGQTISLRGAIAAVGATGLNRNAGGVLIFERDAAGVWRPRPVITVPLDEIAPVTGSERRCGTDGKVGVFDCGNTQLHSFLPPSRMTHDGHVINLSGLWGWTDPQTGKEWALMGRQDGTTFVDISNPSNPIVVADLPLTPGANPSSWREIKVYKDHAYIVSDGAGAHGMQIVDLTRLRRMRPQPNGRPIAITPDTLYTEVQSAHNIVIDEESGFAYATGSRGGSLTCGGGLHMIDIRDPMKPKFAGCFAHTGTGRGAATGYTHDAQCVTYKGPDTRYRGREICIGSNETALSIADVTDKQNPRALSRATYPNTGYTHQGWFDDEQRYFYVNDETDEQNGLVEKTRTLVWDFADLENPRLAKEYFGQESNSDHNLYVRGNLMYQGNYRAGLRILDITDRENPREVGYFDTAPFTANTPGFNGAWSVYPFFKSGTIIVNGTSQGMFIVKQRPVVF
jgi:choice-of-anchor B domain-containing protein